MANGSSIYLSGGLNNIFACNETHGSKTFRSSDYTEVEMILDSLTFVKETLDENLIVADTNNKLKMIYK